MAASACDLAAATQTQLHEQGIALLRSRFSIDSLNSLREVAVRCFEAVEAGEVLPERYQFNRYSNSVLLTALTDFGCDPAELTAPRCSPGLESIFSQFIGDAWSCPLEHSWVRKKFAPVHAPAQNYHLQDWHQDGALGVHFPESASDATATLPMTQLLTCWIPLDACGVDSPGLELVRGPQPGLLHFSELHDASIRRRFAPGQFWIPELEIGDALIFLNSVLHRTYTHPEMTRNRLSVEYRIFPG